MPRYAALIYTAEGTEASPEEWAQVMADYNEGGENSGAAGVILGGEALEDTKMATTLHVDGKGGTLHTTDGPFAEAAEQIGGYYVLDSSDIDTVIDLCRILPAYDIEIRPVLDAP